MEEVNARINFLKTILKGSKALGQNKFNSELFAIHLRKILELIAFGSLIANKEKYSQAHKHFDSHWNAKDMLAYLEEVNPDFYPAPLKIGSIGMNGEKNLDFVIKGFLRKDQFVSLYNRCGGLLHTQNPFSSKKIPKLNTTDVKKWVALIQELLAFHRARLFGATEGWLVVMQHESDGKVHAFPFHALPDPP
ncbi:MAG: hypothetical protein J7L34_06235 [Thermotogaceae bacterium]|nr:hypothetical protein [Thermotogaceae bacterium]